MGYREEEGNGRVAIGKKKTMGEGLAAIGGEKSMHSSFLLPITNSL